MEIEKIEKFDISKIDVDDETFQGRVWYDDSKLESIINDIRTYGQRSPVGIRKSPSKEGMFQIIYGFHRVKAILRMGDETIYAFVYSNITDRDCEELAVRDNEMHADLTPMEKILQCAYLKEKGWTIEELCNAYSIKQALIYRWLEVSKAPKWLLQLLHIDKLSIEHIATLLRIKEEKKQFDLTCECLGVRASVGKLKDMCKSGPSHPGRRQIKYPHRCYSTYLCPNELGVRYHMCHGRPKIKRRFIGELQEPDEEFAEMKQCEYCIDIVKRCPKLDEHGYGLAGNFEWVLCSYQVPDKLKPFWDEYRKQRNVKDTHFMLDEMFKGNAITKEKYDKYSKMDLQILPKVHSSWRPKSEKEAEWSSKPFTLKEQIRLENVIAGSSTVFSETLNNLEQLPGTETKERLRHINEHWIYNDHCSVCGERYWVNDGKKYYKCKKIETTRIVKHMVFDEELGEDVAEEEELPTIEYVPNVLAHKQEKMCFECYVKNYS